MKLVPLRSGPACKPPKTAPQGTAVHIGVEDLLEDSPKGTFKPLEEYTLRAREQWDAECAKSGVYTGKETRGDGRGP